MRESDFNFIKPLKSINLNAILRNALREEERDILDLQQEQLSAGLADAGDELIPGYAKKTLQNKRAKGQPDDRVTLKDTGAFYRGQYVKYSIDHFEITSRDRKRKKLTDKYHGHQGGDVFGLTPENKAILMSTILPIFQDEYRERALKAMRK